MVPSRNGKKVMWRDKTQGEMGSKALRGQRGCVCESLRTNEGFYIAGVRVHGRQKKPECRGIRLRGGLVRLGGGFSTSKGLDLGLEMIGRL